MAIKKPKKKTKPVKTWAQEKKALREEVFILNFIVSNNATKSYEAAYPNANNLTARTEASKLLAKPNVMKRVKKLQNEKLEELNVNAKDVLKATHNLADHDPLHIFNDDGSIKKISEIPLATRKAISHFEVQEYFEGFGKNREQVGVIKKIKFEGRTKNWENLGRYMNLANDNPSDDKPKTIEDIVREYEEAGSK